MAAVGIVQKEDKTRESFARISLASKLELISQLWQGEIGLQCSNVTSVVEFEWAGPTVCANPVTVKLIYSEKATKFCEIFTLLLSYAVPVKSKVKISQNVVAFS